ncbi:2-C-methyl-D-erythritol 4-phosphate cytidylyltransferase [Pedobacter mucosus]|uniref:2-C-methyl-D-erythritol 4-phosphate cytidylyltransferase n=1 Tax=Pedobacter mucosus TaxID=2895286 RepID=UPI001EE44741|nr:2-C-methyl-D-erythritol 4-phosphate cytidylyltransferase [Pedobacter mucosus]UKT65313.1 2-C-methyl-D-erythritol 4-phosphate cytidylyltransferase [Pedobacter mucosus]
MKYYAIIVAGGSGSRMQAETPKQFLLLNNLPILMHTIKAFAECDTKPTILLALSTDQQQNWSQLCQTYNFTIPHIIINGGTQRFYSVKNAIDKVDGKGIVAIHDAVRPLISKKLIDFSFKKAEEIGCVVTAVQSSDSVRLLSEGKTSALKRDEVYLVQTPQVFDLSILKEAYKQEYNEHFTDDASVVESLGREINIIAGERNNIKITFPFDLLLAELLMSS